MDAVIVTKLDGTAKGGIALAVSHELGLPIAKVGVGERLEDLQDFDARDFAAALIGAEPEDEDGEALLDVMPEAEPEISVAAEPQPEPEPVPEAGPICIACGAQLRVGDRFCMYCGARQPEAGDAPAIPVQTQPQPAAEPEPEQQPADAVEEVSQFEESELPVSAFADNQLDEDEDFSAEADAAFEAYEAERAQAQEDAISSDSDEVEPQEPAVEEEPQEETSRIKRMFRWRGRK